MDQILRPLRGERKFREKGGAMKKGLRGYVTSRRFGAYYIPVPLQNLALRDYCSRLGVPFVLSVNENSFENSYLVLEGLVEDIDEYEGIVMCSMEMLPADWKRTRDMLNMVIAQDRVLHFVIENRIVASGSD